jgi:CDP-glucose 4,6-dehydratase
MALSRAFWSGRRVFVTGHTGFKGGWLSLWLSDMGAEVHGYALQPPTNPNFFSVAGIEGRMASNRISDIRDAEALRTAMAASRPEIVLHLAAQPLVRQSYAAPAETYAVNVMGTVHLLEAVRMTPSVKAVVNVTTDKCYENREWHWPYRENEILGGFDPYASSKACSEILTAAWRASFLAGAGIGVATARAGNVVGGGDWAADRLVPDLLRAIDAGTPVRLRNPDAIRPWQHVLEPLSGYLRIAETLCADPRSGAEAWNLGPDENDAKPVSWLVEFLCARLPGASWVHEKPAEPLHEAGTLRLDSSKARARLGWRPRWNLEDALSNTVAWHQAWRRGEDMAAFSIAQIHAYESEQIPG